MCSFRLNAVLAHNKQKCSQYLSSWLWQSWCASKSASRFAVCYITVTGCRCITLLVCLPLWWHSCWIYESLTMSSQWRKGCIGVVSYCGSFKYPSIDRAFTDDSWTVAGLSEYALLYHFCYPHCTSEMSGCACTFTVYPSPCSRWSFWSTVSCSGLLCLHSCCHLRLSWTHIRLPFSRSFMRLADKVQLGQGSVFKSDACWAERCVREATWPAVRLTILSIPTYECSNVTVAAIFDLCLMYVCMYVCLFNVLGTNWGPTDKVLFM